MRILFLPGYRYPADLSEPITSGDLRYTFNISRAMARAGHTVEVISRWRHGDQFDGDFEGVRVFRYRSEIGSVLKTSFDVSVRRARLFKRLIGQADVAFVNSPLSLELLLSFNTRFCYVASGLEDLSNYGRSVSERVGKLAIRAVREPLKRMTWKRADFVNTTAKAEEDTLVSWGVPTEKVCSIGPSVERQRFRPSPNAEIVERRQSLGVGRDAPLILSVARFTPAKGLLGTLDAFAELRAERDDVRMVMVGVEQSHSSRHFEVVRDRLAALDLNDSVIVKLDVQEHLLPSYYSAADLTSVFSESYDPLPTVIIESMACGTPVVSTYCESRRQFIDDQINGMFVAEGDTSAWIDAVRTLLGSPDSSQRISNRGARTVAERFDADRVARQLLDLFESRVP